MSSASERCWQIVPQFRSACSEADVLSLVIFNKFRRVIFQGSVTRQCQGLVEIVCGFCCKFNRPAFSNGKIVQVIVI